MKYDIVYADFPWPYTSFGTAKLPYGQMSELEISNFQWSRFLNKDAIVFSWVTWPRLDLAMRCGEAWRRRYGLHYQGCPFFWVKTKKDGTPIGASGPRPRLVKPITEALLAFSTTPKRRTFKLLTEAMPQTVFAPKPKKHSEKPAVVRDRIVEVLGDRPRIELFARGPVPVGWDGWGHEFEPDPLVS